MNASNIPPKTAEGAGPQLPSTSLIICSRNRPELLAHSVASILEGNAVPTELIIIDQSDIRHLTLPQLRTNRPCDIRYQWTRSVGLSRANNHGIAVAQYDLLVFTHDDVVVTPTWFETIVTALANFGRQSVVTGQVRPSAASVPNGFAPSTKVDEMPAVYAGRLDCDVLYPLNMALHRSALLEVGCFDERLGPGTPFPGAEDSDLGFRLLEAGYRIHYVPQAVLYHQAWRSGRDYLPLRWNYGVARGAFYAKYWSWRDRYMLRRMGREVARLRSFPYRLWSDRRRAAADLALVSGMLFGAARWGLIYGAVPLASVRQHA